MLGGILRRKRTDAGGASMRGVNAYWKKAARGDARRFIGGLWDEIGALQFEFLRGEGLEARSCLVDIGCGCMRGGVHFVRFLEPGRYHGFDINQSLVDLGMEELRRAGLGDRRPQLLVNPAFELSRFGSAFDFGIGQSLFTHLYANHIVRCFVESAKVMDGGSRFYFTYFEAPHAGHLEPIRHEPGGVVSHMDRDVFHYAFGELQAMAAVAGLDAERIGDWGHPRAQRMLRVTRRSRLVI